MITHPKKISPSVRTVAGRCPCGQPSALVTWEANLYVCNRHGLDWLSSEEKRAADVAIEDHNDAALIAALDRFILRIRRRPSIIERIKKMIRAWRES